MKTLALLLLSTFVQASSLENLIKDTQSKVVKIGIVTKKGHGACSGAFISSTGIVLTCAHCFSEKEITKIFIKTEEGKAYPAAILHIDSKVDLALIVPSDLGPFSYFKFGSEPERGQQVVSFGSPIGIQHTVTVGWVANLVRNTYLYIFHSAFVNPGNSGGPLVDLKGRLIGVNEAMIDYGFLQTAQGLFVAIDIVTIKEFLKEQYK